MVRIPITHRTWSAAGKNAGDELDKATETRLDEEETWEQQSGGEVETQTKDARPTAGNPQEGLPGDPSDGPEKGEAQWHRGAPESQGVGSNGPEPTTVARAAAEFDERYLQLAADFENYKRQTDRRIKESRDRALRSVLEDLLPVLDNFERAVDAARNAKDVESVRVGVEFILQQFQSALKAYGVEPIDSRGKPFDPLQHDALEQIEGSGQPHGTVLDEVQRGYTYQGQVLRTSRVRVAG